MQEHLEVNVGTKPRKQQERREKGAVVGRNEAAEGACGLEEGAYFQPT